MDRKHPGTTRSGKGRRRPAMELAMGAPLAPLFIRKLNPLGTRASTWHSRLGRLTLHGLAHPQRRVASHIALGVDGGLLPLAITSIQSHHALSTAHLSTARDDGSMVCV